MDFCEHVSLLPVNLMYDRICEQHGTTKDCMYENCQKR